MKIAGLWSGHDCSFYVSDSGRPVVHAEYERYIREKEPAGDSAQFLLDEYDESDEIVYFATCLPDSKLKSHDKSYEKISEIATKNGGNIFVIGHHQAHAANAFFSSNFENSLVVTIDGGGIEAPGQASAFTVWQGSGNNISHLHTFPIQEINIGGVWTRATRYIFKLQSGWPRGHQAGSVMAMAALGDASRFTQDFLKMLTRDVNEASHKPPSQPRGAYTGDDPKHPYLEYWAEIASRSEQDRYDVAAGLQRATELFLKNVLGNLITSTKSEYLCLSGGVSLNSVAVGKIVEWFPQIKGIYVPPTPHDGGLPIGAAQYAWHQILDNPRITWDDNYTPYLGFTYGEAHVAAAIQSRSGELVAFPGNDDEVVDLLSEGNIIAVFGGGSESGRRALGNRSILADPRGENMKDTINEKVKHRQWYRPFAPSILREEVKNWFKYDFDSPYMSMVLPFKDDVKSKVPAVVHVDGTARLQTVTEKDNKWYYNFIKKWYKNTNVPIVLNTSFNDREPICETADHAIDCFLRTNIDYLYFYDQNILVRKK